jgi:hypothetical protein
MYPQKVKSKTNWKKNFLLASWKSLAKRAGYGSVSVTKIDKVYGSKDLDPFRNVTDPEHWYHGFIVFSVSDLEPESESFHKTFLELTILLFSYKCCTAADPHHIDAVPDPSFHLDVDLNPTCHFDADPDPY